MKIPATFALFMIAGSAWSAELSVISAASDSFESTSASSNAAGAMLSVRGWRDYQFRLSYIQSIFPVSDGKQEEAGIALVKRTKNTNGVYGEAAIAVSYATYEAGERYSQKLDWRSGHAVGVSPEVRVGYKAGSSSMGLSVALQLKDAQIKMETFPNAGCAANCSGLNNIIYSPYAGLSTETGPDKNLEKSLRSSAWLGAYVAVAF